MTNLEAARNQLPRYEREVLDALYVALDHCMSSDTLSVEDQASFKDKIEKTICIIEGELKEKEAQLLQEVV